MTIIKPDSIFFADPPDVYPGIYQGAGSTEDRTHMQFWSNAAGGDATIHYRFEMPPTLPSGTCKLRILARANASSGTLIVNPTWGSVAQTEGPDDATLTAEGNTTLTFTAADAYLESLVTMNADTVVANEVIHMDLVCVSSGTVSVDPGFLLSLIWE